MTDNNKPAAKCEHCGMPIKHKTKGWQPDKRKHPDLPQWQNNKADYTKAYRDKRRTAGLCLACGEPWQGESPNCDECRAIAATKARHKRNKLKQDGICLRCHKATPAQGKLHCHACIKARYNRKTPQSQQT